MRLLSCISLESLLKVASWQQSSLFRFIVIRALRVQCWMLIIIVLIENSLSESAFDESIDNNSQNIARNTTSLHTDFSAFTTLHYFPCKLSLLHMLSNQCDSFSN